jgi:thiol-disulfide isomerase/thioredoxin
MKKNLLIAVCLIIAGTLNAQEIKRWKMNELLQYIQNSDSALIVNFWATFCGPCVEEIPYFQTITEKYKSKKAKLLLVSLDFDENYPNKIAAFAKKHGFTAEIIWLDESKPDEFCPKIDSNWSGAMPASLFVNNQRKYRKFIEAQLNPERVEAEMIHLTGLECPASLPLAKGKINDFEQIFTDAEEQKLEQLVQKISREEKAEIAIVTVEDYQPFESMQLYAFYLSNCWGVGNEDKDDGMVILISKKQRKVRITNGYGIEKQLTDAETKKIIDRNMVPFYKKGLFYRGTANALQEIARELKAFTR